VAADGRPRRTSTRAGYAAGKGAFATAAHPEKSGNHGALRACGIPWCEDASNTRDAFFRNRVRRAVLPAWCAAAQRDALSGAARAREMLEEDDVALETWLAALRPFAKTALYYSTRLSGKPRALLRRALHRWLLAHPASGELSRQGFDALLTATERGAPTRQSLGRDGFAVIARDRLEFSLTGNRAAKF